MPATPNNPAAPERREPMLERLDEMEAHALAEMRNPSSPHNHHDWELWIARIRGFRRTLVRKDSTR